MPSFVSLIGEWNQIWEKYTYTFSQIQLLRIVKVKNMCWWLFTYWLSESEMFWYTTSVTFNKIIKKTSRKTSSWRIDLIQIQCLKTGMSDLGPMWARLAENETYPGPKCTIIWSEKVRDFSHLVSSGLLWPQIWQLRLENWDCVKMTMGSLAENLEKYCT